MAKKKKTDWDFLVNHFREQEEQKKKKQEAENASRFDSFVSDSYRFLTSESEWYGKSDYNTTQKNRNDFSNYYLDWQKKYQQEKDYLDSLQGVIPSDQYDALSSYLGDLGSAFSEIDKGYSVKSDYYSQWKTKDLFEYDQKALGLDIESAQKEISELEKLYNEYASKPKSSTGTAEIIAADSWKKRGYDYTPETLLKEIKNKNAELNRAVELQIESKYLGMDYNEYKKLMGDTERLKKLSDYEKKWLLDNESLFLNDVEKKLRSTLLIGKQTPLSEEEKRLVNDVKTREALIRTKNNAEEYPALSSLFAVASSPLGAFGLADAVVDNMLGNEIDINSPAFRHARANQKVMETVSKEMSDVGKFFYNTGSSIGTSGINMLYGEGGVVTDILNFGGAATNAIVSAKERGVSDSQAILSGIASGFAEMFFERYGIKGFTEIAQSGKAGVFNGVWNLLKLSFTNANEELLTEGANAITDNIINGDLSELNLLRKSYLDKGYSEKEANAETAKAFGLQAAESWLGGFISGGAFGVLANLANSYANKNAGQYLIDANMTEDTANLAAQFEEGSETRKRYEEYAKKLKNTGKVNPSYLGAVARTMEMDASAALSDAGRQSAVYFVSARLKEKGVDVSEELAEAVTNTVYNGRSLPLWAKNELETAGALDYVNELKGDTLSKAKAFRSDSITKAEKRIADVEAVFSEAESRTEKRESAKQYNVDAKGASLDSIEVSENGDVMIRTENGTVPAADAKVDIDTATALAYAEDMSPAMKRSFFENYKENSANIGIDEYQNAFSIAYRGGVNRMNAGEVMKAVGSSISQKSALAIYKQGLEARKAASDVGKNEIAGIQKELGIQNRVAGKVDDSAIRYENLPADDRRRAMVGVARFIAASTGRNVTFFDSTKKQREEGIENGKYDPKTNTIYIDVNAGIDEAAGVFEDSILTTLSHELVHQFAAEDPEGYKLLPDLVFEVLEKTENKTKAQLIEGEINRTKESDPKRFEGVIEEVQKEIAEEELVARACEELLGNSRLMKEFLEEMDRKDSGLAQKFSNMLGEAIKKIKAIFQRMISSYRSNSKEAKALRSMTENLEAIQKQFDDLLERKNEANAVEIESSQDSELQSASVEVDAESESAYPMLSERTWSNSEYVQKRSEAADVLSEALGVSKRKAFAYIDAVNGVAKMIADDRARLDYEASSFGSAFVSNVEYGGSFDYTTLCPKRRLYTGTFSEIQKRIPDDSLSADEILIIRNLMIERGLEATCGLCYVEGSRAEMGKFSKKFIELYKRDFPNEEWYPNMVDVNTPDGVEKMRINHPEVYDQYEYFWNHYGKLKEDDKALFASQQKPKLYEARKEYKNEILQFFSKDAAVEAKNKNGGIRIQSFSDFEMVHMIDTMQVIMDMSRVKLAGQAYTKIPAFADAFGNTGLKINLSLIAKGVDENGDLIFDDREGMPSETAFNLREKYSENVGTILVIFNDDQLFAAMRDPRVDFIIPFHRSQWKKRQYGAMGLPKNTKDYTYQQNEKLIKKTYHEYRGRMVLDKAKNYMPNEYWRFDKDGKWNAENYLKKCAAENKRPKFYKLLVDNGDGSYSLRPDGSTDGYWKLLIDFKMYDNKGKGAPQNPVKPDFSMKEIYESMDEYEGGHGSYPVAYDVVDEFMKIRGEGQSPNDSGDVRYQERPLAKKKKTAYNEYNTNAMQWAKSASRNADDMKVLYDPRRGEYFLIGVSQDSDMGFIELNSGTKNEMEQELIDYAERIHVNATTKAFDTWTEDAEIGYGNDSWDNELPRHGSEEGGDGTVSYRKFQRKQTPDGAGDSSRTEADSGGVRNQDRSAYQSARDILVAYAEDARNTDARSEYLAEYTNRVKALDEKLVRLEAAESKLATAVDSGNEKDAEFFKKRMETLEKNIRTLQSDLTAMENSKELKAIVRREKAETRAQGKIESRERLESFKDNQERRNRISRIEGKVDLLANRILKNNKENHIPDSLKETVSKFITAIDFTKTRTLHGETVETKNSLYFKKLLDDVGETLRKSNLNSLGENTEELVRLDVDPEVIEKINELSKQIEEFLMEQNSFVLSDLATEQLRDLDFVLTGITRALNNIDRSFGANGKAKVSELAEKSISFMKSKKQKEVSDKGFSQTVKRLFVWSNYTPYTAFNRFGEGGKEVYKDLLRGWGRYAFKAREIIDFSEETFGDKSKKWSEEVKEVTLAGKTFKMTTAQIMSFYLTNLRKQGNKHLDAQGFKVDQIKTKGHDVAQTGKPIKATKEQRDTFFEKYLPEGSEERAVADKIQKFMTEKCAAWGNEVSLVRWGYRAFTEEHYFPLYSDKKLFDAGAPEATNFSPWRILNLGMTRSLNANAKNPILVIDVFDVFANHSSDMAKYNTLGLPILNAIRWLNYKIPEFDAEGNQILSDESMKSVMESTYGSDAYNYVLKFLSDINGATKNDTELAESLSGKIAKNAKIAAVAANLKVVVLQPTSILRAADVLSPKSIAKATAILTAGNAKNVLSGEKTLKYYKLAQKYSGLAAWKDLGFFDINISPALSVKIKHSETAKDKAIELSMKGAEKADNYTLGALFKACQIELINSGKAAGLSQEEIFQKAGELLDEVIVRTQVVDSTVTRSQNMRSKSFFMRSVTAFMSEPTISYNMLADAALGISDELKQGKKLSSVLRGKAGNEFLRAFSVYCTTQFGASIVEAFFAAYRDENEEEDFVEKFFAALPAKMLSNSNPFASLPIIKELVEKIANSISGKTYSSSSMETQAIDAIASVYRSLYGMIEDGDFSKETVYILFKKTLKAYSYTTGLPLSNVEREIVLFWNYTFGEIDPDLKITEK